ncbi:hypothetical protein LAUMK41_00244 [Mycobacterium attenuatum]|nr:hypothetical protein LAUMK41_00244 [Mycobacterium attenuatum]
MQPDRRKPGQGRGLRRWRIWRTRDRVGRSTRRGKRSGASPGARYGRAGRDAGLENQPWSPVRVAGGDVLTTSDGGPRHPHAVQIGAVSAAVDHHPVGAVEPQHEVLTRHPGAVGPVQADVRPDVAAHRDVAARRKGVHGRADPHGQRRRQGLRPHGCHLPSPSSPNTLSGYQDRARYLPTGRASQPHPGVMRPAGRRPGSSDR